MNTQSMKIITLCCSSRFVDVMAVCAWLIERDEPVIALEGGVLGWDNSAELGWNGWR